MGIISMSVSHSSADEPISGVFRDKPVKRLSRATVSSIVHEIGIPMHHYTAPNMPPLTQMTVKQIHELQVTYTVFISQS